MPSNPERKARRAKQTRLTFNPIDINNSSPSAASMSPAKVRYQIPNRRTSPSSSRQTYNEEGESDDAMFSDKKLSSNKKHNFSMNTHAKRKRDGKLPFKALPNPAKSAHTEADSGSSSAGKSSVCSALCCPFVSLCVLSGLSKILKPLSLFSSTLHFSLFIYL